MTPVLPIVQVTAGAVMPAAANIFNNAFNETVLHVQFYNASSETVNLDGISLTASGSGNDAMAYTGLVAWRDLDNNAIFNPGDSQAGSASGFPADNGTISLNLSPFAVAPGATVSIYVLSSFNGSALPGETFALSLAVPSTGLLGTGSVSGLPLNVTGASVNGNTFTIVAPTATLTPSPTALPILTNTPVPGVGNVIVPNLAFNSSVRAMKRLGNTLYVGGDFGMVGPMTGHGAVLDASSAALQPDFPRIAGDVWAVVGDGNGVVTFALFKLIPITLTLPGIAAIALALGIKAVFLVLTLAGTGTMWMTS
jgi:hypothetical protein